MGPKGPEVDSRDSIRDGHPSSNRHWNQWGEANCFWGHALGKEGSGTYPIGLLARMGVTMVHLRHPRCGKVTLSIKQNCPYVGKKWGAKLINEVENDMGKQLCALRLGLPDVDVMVTREELEKWFPEATADQINKLVAPKAVNAEELPFNRDFRQRIQKAKAVVINLFCGNDPKWWTKKMPPGVEVIDIDLVAGQDVLDDELFSYLLQIAGTKRVLALLAWPPCRTASVLRTRDDAGPRVLRSREGDERWV